MTKFIAALFVGLALAGTTAVPAESVDTGTSSEASVGSCRQSRQCLIGMVVLVHQEPDDPVGEGSLSSGDVLDADRRPAEPALRIGDLGGDRVDEGLQGCAP